MELPKSVKPAVIAAVTNALVAMPSMAGEPGKIFDFNLTLPIIATEFLLLMVILDKTIFGPVGKALDDRDALIRDQLAAVGDNSTAVADLIVRTRNAQRDPLPNPSASSEGERTCPRPARVSLLTFVALCATTHERVRERHQITAGAQGTRRF